MYILVNKLYNDGKPSYIKQSFTRGGKIFFAFLLIAYLFPLFLNLIYTIEYPLYRLNIHSPIVLIKILLLIFVSIISLLITRYTPIVTLKKKVPIKPLPKWFIILISLLGIIAGLILNLNDLINWRNNWPMLGNPIILYAAILQDTMPILIFWVIITDHRFILSRSISDMLIKGIMLLALISILNGITAIFLVIIFILFLVQPQSTLDLLFLNSVKKKSNPEKIKKIVLLLFIFPIMLLAGNYAKTGKNYKPSEIFSSYLNFDYLLGRHSTHLSALASSIEDGYNIEYLKIPINTFIYRWQSLYKTQDATNKNEEVESLSKVSLNNFTLYEKKNPREGSSPGLLASFTMTLPFPFAVLATFLTTFILVKFIDFIFYAQIPFSWVGAFIFAYIPLKYFTDSPLDNLAIGPHYFFFLFILLASCRRKNSNY
jgi:hypothetical protein